MKKILLFIIAVTIFIPSICFANYFDQYPKRYIDYDSTEQYKSYLDINSVTVRRYDPPFYTIDATTYTFDYVYHTGYVKVNRYFYDYRNQEIKWQVLNVGLCDEQGNIDMKKLDRPLNYKLIYLEKYSSGYLAAELCFMKAYNMPFSIELKERFEQEYNQNTSAEKVKVDNITKANDLLAKHDYSFPLIAVSEVDDDGFLAFSKGDKYTGFIIYDKKTGTIASVDYTPELLNLRANPVMFNDKKHYNPIRFTLNVLNTTQGDTDSKLGEWQYSTHKIPVYAIFDVDENGNIVPQKFMTGEGLNPKKFDKSLTELRNINLVNIVLTHSDSLKQDITRRNIAVQ